MSGLVDQIEESKEFLLARCKTFPKSSVVLGSGLNQVLRELRVEVEVPYSEIPHMLPSTVEGHVGKFLVGDLGGVRIACMQGRLHYYEGYSMSQVVFPVRLLAACGVENFLLTNAAGGIHPDMRPGEFLVIEDHINLTGTSPLIGKNEKSWGPRFPDMTFAYDKELRALLLETGKRCKVPLRKGIYVGFHGPTYETPAEIRMARTLGGDVVGMSTVPETIALRHMGKRVAGLSCITNLAAGVTNEVLVHSEVLENAVRVENSLGKLIREFFVSVQGTYAKS